MMDSREICVASINSSAVLTICGLPWKPLAVQIIHILNHQLFDGLIALGLGLGLDNVFIGRLLLIYFLLFIGLYITSY